MDAGFRQMTVYETPALTKRQKHPFGWAFRVADDNRLRALEYVLTGLSGDLLDFGCGSKPYEAALRHQGINQWYGVDLPVRTSGDDYLVKADGFIEDGKIPCADQTFDILFTTQVLEHVVDLDLTMTEISRVLKVGGSAVITVPMTSILHEEPYDFRRFTPYGMAKLAERFGMTLETSIALEGPMSTIATLMACHSNFLCKIPVFGQFLSHLAIEFANVMGRLLDGLSHKAGLNMHSICLDYLFLLKKK